MQDNEITVGECAHIGTELVPVTLEEYVDGYGPVAFPPPDVGQIQEHTFGGYILYGTKVIDRGYGLVLILYDAHVFCGGIAAQGYKRVFFRQLGKDVCGHRSNLFTKPF
jgi:hypothetical protein